MLLLTSTADLIQIVTASAVAMECHATFVDNNAGTITPNRTNTEVTTATTATLVGSPAASTQRNVQTLLVRNNHASSSNDVTIRHTDGTTAVDVFKVTLAAGEVLQFADGRGFQVYTVQGAVKQTISQGTNAPSGSAMTTVVLAADVTNSNATANTIADVTGLSFAVTAGLKYYFQFTIAYTAAAGTTGSRWSINGPTITLLAYSSRYSLTTTTETLNHLVGYDLPAAANATSPATTGNLAVIQGILVPSASGTVIARFASEVSSSAIVAKAGSVLIYQQVA